jgi:aspartyl-tRNA(Asn)/glutamyl-tRNA(Gln) amidotransferase subunit C
MEGWNEGDPVSHIINVPYIAELARLALTSEETSQLQGQLEDIVRYVEKIGQLDVTNIEPTLHGQGQQNVLRDDVAVPSSIREIALANAPARNGYEIKLPKIVEEA